MERRRIPITSVTISCAFVGIIKSRKLITVHRLSVHAGYVVFDKSYLSIANAGEDDCTNLKYDRTQYPEKFCPDIIDGLYPPTNLYDRKLSLFPCSLHVVSVKFRASYARSRKK